MNTGERIEWKKVKVGKQTQSNLPPATSTPPPRIPIQLESFHQINLETYIITISIEISIKIKVAILQSWASEQPYPQRGDPGYSNSYSPFPDVEIKPKSKLWIHIEVKLIWNQKDMVKYKWEKSFFQSWNLHWRTKNYIYWQRSKCHNIFKNRTAWCYFLQSINETWRLRYCVEYIPYRTSLRTLEENTCCWKGGWWETATLSSISQFQYQHSLPLPNQKYSM